MDHAGLGLRVLVVDDYPDARDSVQILVELWGHHVQTASDGLTALEKARSFRPHVVLLDIAIPKLSGYEVARRLRQMTELQDLLIVAVTGLARPEDQAKALASGCNHHLTKPYSVEQLQSLLAAHAARLPRGT